MCFFFQKFTFIPLKSVNLFPIVMWCFAEKKLLTTGFTNPSWRIRQGRGRARQTSFFFFFQRTTNENTDSVRVAVAKPSNAGGDGAYHSAVAAIPRQRTRIAAQQFAAASGSSTSNSKQQQRQQHKQQQLSSKKLNFYFFYFLGSAIILAVCCYCRALRRLRASPRRRAPLRPLWEIDM